jgi:predicted phage gp36 major capsid-like protein
MRKTGEQIRRKLQRRAEAEARQKEFLQLSLQEKLEKISKRPGNSKKEIAKLTGE